MDGWGKIAAGVVLGVAGTVYATNRKVREKLPDAARDLPDNVRGRFRSAVSAAREASASRRREILDDLQSHAEQHPPRQEAAEREPEPDVVKTGPDETKQRSTT